jgi:hypothetical protein
VEIAKSRICYYSGGVMLANSWRKREKMPQWLRDGGSCNLSCSIHAKKRYKLNLFNGRKNKVNLLTIKVIVTAIN